MRFIEVIDRYIPNVWEWITSTTSLNDIIQASAVVTLVYLFATNRIVTKGQHEARIKDLTDHHEREREAGKEAYDAATKVQAERYAEMRESRDYYRTGRQTEKNRADQATEQLHLQGQETRMFMSKVMGGLAQAVEEVHHDGPGPGD